MTKTTSRFFSALLSGALFGALAIAQTATGTNPSTTPVAGAATMLAAPVTLFTDYTRDTYRAATGLEAPVFDVTKRPKPWADPAGAGTYNTYGTGTTLAQFSMSPAEAMALNLPGVPQYPAYTVAAGSVVLGATNALINSDALSTLAQAQAMQQALGYGVVYEQKSAGDNPNITLTTAPAGTAGMNLTYVYPAGESRRVYTINLGPGSYLLNVGFLLRTQNAQGIGYPGHWDSTVTGTQQQPAWVPATLPTGPTNPALSTPWPDPIRNLNPGETVIQTLFGPTISTAPPTSATSTSSSTDAAIAALQAQVAQILAIITREFGN